MDAGGNQSIAELLCNECNSCIDEEEDASTYEDTCSSSRVAIDSGIDDDEYMIAMIEREKKIEESMGMSDGSFDKCARAEAIGWMLEMREMLGLELRTAYLSISYFDRFLAKRSISSDQPWAFRLLSIACISLAAKMEEIRVPPLMCYQGKDYNFGGEVVRKMELLLLSTLEWKMLSVSPFVFFSLFRGKLCGGAPPNGLKKKAYELIIGLLREENSVMHKPSAIAAAAIVVAMEKSITIGILNPLLNAAFPFYDDALRCYEIMRKINVKEKLESLEKGSAFMVSTSDRSKRRRLRIDPE